MILLPPKENPYNNPVDREREEDGMLSKYEIFEAGARVQLKKVVEWGNGDCEHYPPNPKSRIFKKGLPRRDCPECWQALLKEVE